MSSGEILRKVKSIKECYVTWKTFKKYFKIKYLSEQYYEEKAKEFYELFLGAMTVKELCSKFLSLLHYVPYVIDEKPNFQCFLSCLPLMFKERIKYDNLKTLEEVLRKKIFYDQNKKTERTYIIGKIKDVKILNKKRKVLSCIRTLGIIIGDTKRIILKIINIGILQQ